VSLPTHEKACGPSCGKALVGTGKAISPLLYTNGLRKQSSGHVTPKMPLRQVRHQPCRGYTHRNRDWAGQMDRL